MARRGFYDRAFDDATQIKLGLFRGYIREWIPVFLNQPKRRRGRIDRICIYDFFAGPGQDGYGNPGSPAIIVEELKQYCQENEHLKANNISVNLVFNDIKESYINQLKANIKNLACPKPCCSIEYTALPFQDALQTHLPDIRSDDIACLVIMDQFGVKEVTPDLIRQLAECRATDILFFISSSYLWRFNEVLPQKSGIEADALKNSDYNRIHREICDHFRSQLHDMTYYLAPFSIRKDNNIYGVIFGSNHLLGLRKFLRVCWSLDSKTGEANYSVDRDRLWNGGQLSFCPEDNTIRKLDLWERQLREFLQNESPDNRELYEFCLLHGFLPKHARSILRVMQDNQELSVIDPITKKSARRGSYYLDHNPTKKVRFITRYPNE